MYLEQPQGNYTLPKAGAEQKTQDTEALKELIGKYQAEKSTTTIEITGACAHCGDDSAVARSL